MENKDSIFNEINKNCCFTGHRALTADQIKRIKLQINRAVKALASTGVTNFITGGALGFDTVAAECVLELKDKGHEVRLLVAVPCRDQSERWKPRDIAVYNRILAAADETVCLSENYSREAMLARNRFMVDHSSCCLAFVTEEKSGSAYTMRYAGQTGKQVINLAEVSW